MGDENRCFDCCEQECIRDCREKCCRECCCDDGDNNILGLLILLVVLFCLFCNNIKGGLFGGLF